MTLGITRKHPRASTSKLTLEQYDDDDDIEPSTSFSRNSPSPIPQSAEEAQEDDSFYESDIESLQSEGIQEQLVGSRTYINDIYDAEARHMSSEGGVMDHYDDLDGEIVEVEDIDMEDLVETDLEGQEQSMNEIEQMDASTLETGAEIAEDVDGEAVIIEDVTDIDVDGEMVDLGDLSLKFKQAPIDVSRSSTGLVDNQQKTEDQDLLVSHLLELNQNSKRVRELNSANGDQQTEIEDLELPEDEDFEEEEEGEIREDPISRRASRNSIPISDLSGAHYRISAGAFSRERSIESSSSDHYGSSSNARYSKTRRLDSQDRRFSSISTSTQERPSSAYSNRAARHSLPYSGPSSTRYLDSSAHYIVPSSTSSAFVDSRFPNSRKSSVNSRQSEEDIHARTRDSHTVVLTALSAPTVVSSPFLFVHISL